MSHPHHIARTHNMNDRVTDVVAAAAVTSPWWATSVAHLSEFAATVTPIIGVLWLLMQIFSKTVELYQKFLETHIKREQARYVQERMRAQAERERFYDAGKVAADPVAGIREKIHRAEGDTWPET